MSTVKTYLICYNVFMFVGWSYIMYSMLFIIDPFQLYPRIELVLKIVQTGAILEVVHAATGLVKSNPVMTGCQVFSRVFVIWVILHGFVESQQSIGLILLLLAWTITELIRYPFYIVALTSLKEILILTHLRYTLFLGLYPIGVSGELICMYSILKPISTFTPYNITMPNSYNFTFNFYYFIIFIMLLYIPVFPQLYGHMLNQRKRVLFDTRKKTQ